MLTISTSEIRDAIVEKLRSIVPSFEPLRPIGWSYTPGPRVQGRAALQGATRNFDLVFGAGTPLYLRRPAASWVGGSGTAYGCRMAVAISYMGVEPSLLEHMITQDAVDLRRALDQLRDPTLPGFVNAEPQGIPDTTQIDGEGNVVLEHVFELSYHQATPA